MCIICYEDYSKDDITIKLLCNHSYHSHCFSEWISVKKSCPLCNLPLKKRKKRKKNHNI